MTAASVRKDNFKRFLRLFDMQRYNIFCLQQELIIGFDNQIINNTPHIR